MLKQLKSVFTRSKGVRSDERSKARRSLERTRTEALVVQRNVIR